MYYSHRYLYYNSLYINTLDALLMTPKGSQTFRFGIFGGHLGHTLDTPCSLDNRLIPPFYPPFGRLDHETSLATANIRPISPENAVFRLPSKSPKSHKSLCRGFNAKNPTF